MQLDATTMEFEVRQQPDLPPEQSIMVSEPMTNVSNFITNFYNHRIIILNALIFLFLA